METKISVKLFLASTLVSFAALVGCNQVEEEDFPITINIDVEQGRSINADDYLYSQLETNDSALISFVDEKYLVGDTLVIGTFASVFDFDVKTGAFYHKIGRQGNGHGEYNGKSGMYVYDGIVGINSENSRSINKYNLDGDFLGSVRYEVADKGTIPLELMALNDTCFISMNVFKGIPNKTPRFSLYTSDFKLIRDIEGFFVNSGYLRYDMVRSHGGRMFFANMFSPDVYLFDANSTQAELAYIVDFGKYTANPSDVNPDDEYESMQWYGKDDHLKYYSIVQGFYDDGKRIHFICMGGNGVNIVCYDKASKKSQITKIDVDEEKQRIEFNVLYGKDGIYMFVDNLEKPKLNPAVLRIPYDVVAVI